VFSIFMVRTGGILRARALGAAALVALCASCATIGTLPFEAGRLVTFPKTARDWRGPDTTIPRVYGGVALDLATLSAPEGFAWLDLPFSLLADTLLLPYTICAQLRHGSLELRAPVEKATSPR
jgi:uncharacterized protein YceK